MIELDEIYNQYVKREIKIPDNINPLKRVSMVKDYVNILNELQSELNSKLTELQKTKNEADFSKTKEYAESLVHKYHKKYGFEIK